MKRVAIYLRVSTSKQDTDNQRRELEAVAARSGWHVVKIYEDAGISGAKGRDKRPGLDAMLKAVNAKEFDMVASWSVDRLGRSLTDLLGISKGFTIRVLIYSCTSRASIPRPPPARPCFKCWAYLLSSSEGSFERG
jgi:DNA invertase Pin-like site-specific DNA recombinase